MKTRSHALGGVKVSGDRKRAVLQAQDLIFVLNELERLDKTDVDRGLAGRFDLRHVGVFGHSRGGFTAPHACLLDSRFRACLNLDGYPLTPAVMERGIRQPYMHIEEIAPWLPPPTDEQLKQGNQTREEANKQAQEAEQQREKTFSKMSAGMYLRDHVTEWGNVYRAAQLFRTNFGSFTSLEIMKRVHVISTRMMLFRTARQTICSSKDGCRRTVRSSVRSPRRRVELRS